MNSKEPPHIPMTGSFLHVIKIADDRVRRDFPEDKLEELAASIYKYGLFHPPVVHKGDMTLCAGERRIRAITMLAECGLSFTHNGVTFRPGYLPVSFLEDLPLDERLEAELHENLHREDLTWQEKLAGLHELHKLRQSQHGARVKGIVGVRETVPGWGVKDTAREIVGDEPTKTQIQQTQDSIELGEYLDDPMIMACKDEKEARKIIKELQKEQRRAALAKDFDQRRSNHTAILGNCYSDSTPIIHGTYDCIVADPPYGRNMHKHKFDKGRGKHEYDDSEESFDQVLKQLPHLAIKWTKPDAHIYVFCDILNFRQLWVAFEVAGWTVNQRPIIWSKGHIGTFGNSDYDPRHVYDAILYARRGEKKVTAMYPDCIDDIHYDPQSLPHPAGKPPELYINLLRRSCYPGERVLDPYAGGGTIYHAAQALKLHATGVEESERSYEMCVEAIQEAQLLEGKT